jgi:methyl-accepting chemotaxis protein
MEQTREMLEGFAADAALRVKLAILAIDKEFGKDVADKSPKLIDVVVKSMDSQIINENLDARLEEIRTAVDDAAESVSSNLDEIVNKMDRVDDLIESINKITESLDLIRSRMK